MYVIRATATCSGSGEMVPQVRCGCGAEITTWTEAPAAAPNSRTLRVTCPACNAKNDIRFTEVSPGLWTVGYFAPPEDGA